jgi:hypothetical protein
LRKIEVFLLFFFAQVFFFFFEFQVLRLCKTVEEASIEICERKSKVERDFESLARQCMVGVRICCAFPSHSFFRYVSIALRISPVPLGLQNGLLAVTVPMSV